MNTYDFLKPNQDKLPGVSLSVTEEPSGGLRIQAIFGETLGADIVVWYAHVPRFRPASGDAVDAFMRPVDALIKIVDDAFERGRAAGVIEGHAAAQQALAEAAKTFATALGLRAG